MFHVYFNSKPVVLILLQIHTGNAIKVDATLVAKQHSIYNILSNILQYIIYCMH